MKKSNYLIIILIGIFSVSKSQSLTYKGFADFDANFTKDHFGFNFGGFNNYISSQITDRLTIVGELIVQPSQGNEFRVDVERIHATYEFNDYFKLRVGRFYAPIGYYTTHFYSDHAATIAPSIERPAIVAFEDDGGILETRATGIMLSGSNITPLRLSYDVALTNGIGSNSKDDNDSNKAVTVRLSINPVEGLTLGGGARFDKLDSAATSRVTNAPIGETMHTNNFSGFISYLDKHFLIMGEFYSINNKSKIAGSHNSEGAFAFAGYTIKEKITPYLQYNYLNVSGNDIYYSNRYNENGLDLGIKYSFTYQSIIKAEYHVDAKMALLQYAIGF